MSRDPKTNRFTIVEAIGVVARWGLGCLFIYMGISKALHPEAFLKLVRQYEMVTSPFVLNSIAAALPWFEVFCGLLLVAGIAVRGAALNVLVMLIPFTWIVFRRALAISSAQGLAFCAVKFDCGCGFGEVVICHKLIENVLLIALSCWLLTGRGRALAARFSLWKHSTASGGEWAKEQGGPVRQLEPAPPARVPPG